MKTLGQLRISRIPQVLGACASDSNRLLAIVNEAQERLVMAGGEAGWWGTWQYMVFNTDPDWHYIACPRSVARLINASICKDAIRIQNQFYEFLEAGYGQMPNTCCTDTCNPVEIYDRGMFPTQGELNTPTSVVDSTTSAHPKTLRVYATDARDYGKNVVIQALDQNGNNIRSLYAGIDMDGFVLTLASPFVESPMTITKILGVQKDITVDRVTLYEVDTVTSVIRLLSTLEPSEQVSSFRRYFINRLPDSCCDTSDNPVQVKAMAKLDFVPVSVDTDYLIIGNLPALKLECEAVRYSEMDSEKAQKMAILKHSQAVRMLNKELEHRLGRERPALHFAPFGTATLEKAGVGMI